MAREKIIRVVLELPVCEVSNNALEGTYSKIVEMKRLEVSTTESNFQDHEVGVTIQTENETITYPWNRVICIKEYA